MWLLNLTLQQADCLLCIWYLYEYLAVDSLRCASYNKIQYNWILDQYLNHIIWNGVRQKLVLSHPRRFAITNQAVWEKNYVAESVYCWSLAFFTCLLSLHIAVSSHLSSVWIAHHWIIGSTGNPHANAWAGNNPEENGRRCCELWVFWCEHFCSLYLHFKICDWNLKNVSANASAVTLLPSFSAHLQGIRGAIINFDVKWQFTSSLIRLIVATELFNQSDKRIQGLMLHG
jgi:hypothetical protein